MTARRKHSHRKGKTKYVEECFLGSLKCQQMKNGKTKVLEIQQPFEIPSQRWSSITMDMLTHLRLTHKGFNTITTFVDRKTKQVHWVASRKSDSTEEVSTEVKQNAFWSNRLPDDLLSDRDPKHTSGLWKLLTDQCGIEMEMSTSRHL